MTRPLFIAQNLNSSDPAVHAALAAGDARWLRRCARRIEATGVDLIDCNAGTFGRSEAQLLGWMVDQIAPMLSVPLSIDSADPEVLVSVAGRSGRAVLLNSLPVDFEWTAGLRRALADARRLVVLSLRCGPALPPDAGTRMQWAREGLARLEAGGVGPERVLVDAIALPRADDVEAQRPLLDFMAAWARGGSKARTLVGLGNIGHGHPDAVRIHREWMGRLRDVGIGAVLMDAFEPGLRSAPAPPD